MPVTEIPAGGLGDAFTPDQWASYVLDHLSAASVVLGSGATEIRTNNQVVHVPRVTGSGQVGWYSELEEIGPGDPTGDQLTLTPKKCAALTVLSNEAVDDASPSVLDATGTAMVRAVALEVDRAFFAGAGGEQPTGILTMTPALPSVIGAVDYAHIVEAAGLVRAAGGVPNALYLNPADLTALQLVTAADDRPLIQSDPTQPMAERIAGLRIWATPAVPAATAVVAMASQLVVAVRRDASVAISQDAKFTADGTVARVVARADIRVGDPDGLAVIKATSARAAKN
jgi:HK97 family phage major capsid protein